MENSLVVSQPRRLSLPDSCLFAPTELQISPNCSQRDFERIVRAVSQLDTAGDLWVCDGSAFAVETWGKDRGLEIMSAASGYKKPSLWNSHLVALNFPPAKRFPGYKAHHYMRMIPFPVEFRDAFLSRHVGENLTIRGLRLLAVKEFGSNPAERCKAPKLKKRGVMIPEELYEQVRTQIGKYGNVCTLVENLFRTWLKQQAAVVIPAPVVTAPVVEEPRPTYAERRTAQLKEDPMKRIQPKEKQAPKLRIAWTACSAEQFIDSENGPVQYKGRGGQKPANFYSEVDALAAEQKHFEECGYHERVKKCDACSGGNARVPVYHVVHIFTSEGESK